MKIIVTGGAGFIGSFLVDRLIAEGHEVLSLDNFKLGTEKHFAHHKGNPAFKFQKTDVSDEIETRKIFSDFKPETVFHFAANSDIESGAYDFGVDFKDTLLTTVSALKAAEAAATKEIIFASTSAIYGTPNGKISETTGPLLPESNYGAAKLASEAFLFSFAQTHNVKAWSFRFPNVCGPRATHGVFVNFLRFLKKDPTRITVAQDGNQSKPYIYVTDLIDAVMLGWKKSKEKLNIFNIGNEPLVSVNEILKSLLKEKNIADIKIEYTGKPAWPGDVRTYDFDDSKMRKLGYKPKYNSKEATEVTAKELVHNPQAAIAI